ncbi:MAG: carboxypeptidase regulatory-like domain-containing protein [Acidobacteriota bacterium]
MKIKIHNYPPHLLLRLMVALAVAALGVAAHAQTAETGAIVGRVLDRDGQPMANVVVTGARLDGSNMRTEVTDNGGRFRLGLLPPGEYRVTVQALEIERSRRGVSFSNFLPPSPEPPRGLDGLGPVGGGMHTEEEWVSLESLHRRTAWLARMLVDGPRREAPDP